MDRAPFSQRGSRGFESPAPFAYRDEQMPKRKEPELTPEEQFKRFREAAKKAEVDETGKQADEAFQKLSRPSRKTPSDRR